MNASIRSSPVPMPSKHPLWWLKTDDERATDDAAPTSNTSPLGSATKLLSICDRVIRLRSRQPDLLPPQSQSPTHQPNNTAKPARRRWLATAGPSATQATYPATTALQRALQQQAPAGGCLRGRYRFRRPHAAPAARKAAAAARAFFWPACITTPSTTTTPGDPPPPRPPPPPPCAAS